MIALVAADNVPSIALPDFHLILARQLQCSLDRLRPSAAKVNRAVAEVLPGKLQQLARILLSHWGGELAAMHKFKRTGLLCHCLGNFRHAMADKVNRGRPTKIEIFFALCVPEVSAMAAHGRRERLAE